MNTVRHAIPVLAALTLIYLGSAFSASSFLVIVDPPSALLVIGIPLLLLKAGWSFRGMGAAFRHALSSAATKAELEDARLFFATAFRYLMVTGPLVFLLGIIAMLGNVGDPSKIGPNLAVALISPFYCLVAGLVLCLPLEAAAKRRLGALE